MFLKEVWKRRRFLGPKKRYYFGWAQNIHNFQSHGFLIDADWFDTLSRSAQEKVYDWEHRAAYKTSLPRDMK